MNNYYDCKLIIKCPDDTFQYFSYRNKLSKSNFLDNLFKKNDYVLEKNNFDLYMVYEFDSSFSYKTNSKILDKLHNENFSLSKNEDIDALIFYEITNNKICTSLINQYYKFDTEIQNKIKQFFKKNENLISQTIMKNFNNICEIEKETKFEINENIIKLTLHNGEIKKKLIPKKIKKDIIKKFGDLRFDIISGEENDTRRTMGSLRDIDFTKLELLEMIVT